MRMPTQEQINVAIMWLQSNEGEDGELSDCNAVAQWLQHQAHNAMLREEARAGGDHIQAYHYEIDRLFAAIGGVEAWIDLANT